jgi:hypothetical protein
MTHKAVHPSATGKVILGSNSLDKRGKKAHRKHNKKVVKIYKNTTT